MIENINPQELLTTHLLPWGIKIAVAAGIFFIGRRLVRWGIGLIKRVLAKGGMDEMLVNFVASISNAALMLFVVIAALNHLGVDTTSLVALLGAAGLAVGLSLKDSLQNFAAGVMLIVFRPFKTGDFIEAAGVSGSVEAISLLSTLVRTGDNREVIVPNGAIYGGTITNYSARETRRIDMQFGIAYEADMRLAKESILVLLQADERVLSEPAPLVAVAELADNSVNLVVRPWVKSSDYWPVYYTLTEQVKEAFDEKGIAIPYPQLQVHLEDGGSV